MSGPNLTRRTLTRLLGGLPFVGSASFVDGDGGHAGREGDAALDGRRLELTTDAELAEYRIVVEGHAEPGDHADTHEHEHQDTVECAGSFCEIHGYVGRGGLDDFLVSGEIVFAGADEPVTATVADVPIAEFAGARLGTATDDLHLELTTRADRAEYWLTVEGRAEPGVYADTHEHEFQDTVECADGTCKIHGYVAAGGIDDFHVDGEIGDAGADEPVVGMATGTIPGGVVAVHPDEEITVAPGTMVQFEARRPHWFYDGQWWIDGERAGISMGAQQGFDYGYGRSGFLRHTFESEGTYEVIAGERADGGVPDGESGEAAAWTVYVEPGGSRAPVLDEARPRPDDPLTPDEIHELALDVSDPDGRLDRVVWWLGFSDLVYDVSEVSGHEDTASIRFESTCHGCPISAWIIDKNGAVSLQGLWAVGIPEDDPDEDPEDDPDDDPEDDPDDDPEDDPDDPARRHLELTTDAEVAEYWITVEGHAEPGDHADTHPHEYQDTVECADGTCKVHGYVAAGGIDDFYVEGEIVDAGADEPVMATLDGETVPIEELPD